MGLASHPLLKLHLAQAERAIRNASNNVYSDKHKQEYQDNLSVLFNAIHSNAKKDKNLSEENIYHSYKRHIDFIFKSLEFLDSSTFNQIPYEIIECLNYAMHDWLGHDNQYIIVTSLINNVDQFSFDPSLAFNDVLYDEIKIKYEIEFPRRLVQINLPRPLSRDYLASVVLYHELGHFVDLKFKYTESLTRNLLTQIVEGTIDSHLLPDILTYLSFLKEAFNSQKKISKDSLFFRVTNLHLAEYFCDLFASQYIGDSSNFYLKYLTENSDRSFETHPSTVNRIQIVNDFLLQRDNSIIKYLQIAIKNISGIELKQRSEIVPNDDFLNLIPFDINSNKQLHGLFNMGWKIWLQDIDKLQESLNNQYPNPLYFYDVINNLIEKSIGNYITLNKWKKAKMS